MNKSQLFFLSFAKVLAAAVISLVLAFLVFCIAGIVFQVWGREALRIMFFAVLVDMLALQAAFVVLVWHIRRSEVFSREEKSEWSKKLIFNPLFSIFYFIHFMKNKAPG